MNNGAKLSLISVVSGLFIGLMSLSNAYAVTDAEKAAINADLDKAAQHIAKLLGTPAFRKFLAEEKNASRNREQVLVLEDTLQKTSGRAELGLPPGIVKKIQEILTGTKVKMKAAKYQAAFVNFDLYFPVVDHRKKWEGEEELLVAFSPADDEKKVTSITAYKAKSGEKVSLDPAKAPDVPTLVIALEEHIDHKLVPPLQTVPEPKKEAGVEQIDGTKLAVHHANSYIGIPYVLLTDDQEPWIKGDPEVFVLVGQSYKTGPIESTIYLPNVNKENTWYYIGDGPGYPLYFYFTTADYSDLTYFDFWEQDSGSNFTVNASVQYSGVNVGLQWTITDGDDHYGKRYINKSQVSDAGFLRQSTGYVQFDVDRDP